MANTPRNSRYRTRRQSIDARHRRQHVVLGLAALALLLALLAVMPRSMLPGGGTVSPVGEVSASSTALPATQDPYRTGIPPVVEPTTLPAGDAPTTLPAPTLEASSGVFFDQQRLSYEPNFYQPEIQTFLEAQPGTLKQVRFQVGDRSQSFAEVLVGMSNLYSLNPKIFLTLLEQQSRLLSTAQPSADQLALAMAFDGDGGNQRGLFGQLFWAARELRGAIRDYATRGNQPLPPLVFADDEVRQDVPADISLSRYTLERVLARTTTPEQLGAEMDTFLATYLSLFDDPRVEPTDWPASAEPFLTRPMETVARVTSFFDHDTPFLRQNGSILTYWGRYETDIAFAYDGHTGWDYALSPPDPVLAAAPGTVVFAGNSDDGCGSPARGVVIDHGNGYRTLYWHLSALGVAAGQLIERGEQLGVAGATGCAFGPHLHLQVQYLGRDVDPYGWCSSDADPWQGSAAGQRSTWLWADMPSPCGPPPPDMVVVDETSPGFVSSGTWQRNEIGYNNGSLFAETNRGTEIGQPWRLSSLATPAVAVWKPVLPQAGRYRVIAYVPYALNGLEESQDVRYLVRHSGGETAVGIDSEEYRNWWADLGTYEFDPADMPLVSMSTLAEDGSHGVWVDAVAWVPVP